MEKKLMKMKITVINSFMFRMMAGMQKTNDWNNTDREYWENHGWLADTKPF